MSYVFAFPELMSGAATDVASIGSMVATANQGMAAATTAVVAAAEDEVSEAIAAFFSAHGRDYLALSAQAAAFHERFVQALTGAAGAYATAEAAGAAPLATFEQAALGIQLEIQQISTTIASGFNSGLASLTSIPGNPLLMLLASDIPPLSWVLGNSPPPLLNLLLGQSVQYTTYQGMSVVQITPAAPTGEYVVALHGGAYILPASLFHWINYSVTAYQTGATFEVPIYPLLQQGGTAATVVPQTAGFISSQIAQHGAQNVSVVGDSAGGNLALGAVQYLVSQSKPVPSSMVLLSPWLDVGTGGLGAAWAGNLPAHNYLVSPLYGSLDGLPPTYVYSGSLDPLAQQAAVLQQAALAQGAPMSFSLEPGGIHDWILLTPGGLLYWPQINQQLGIVA
ncbi:lipase [Mycobacterium kansasii]|uniref:Triacylglycerol lipase n=2 Tax=Mycobacterium attenuatum TaxID=2341086 RepID=A0A498PY16_9MYCO|nr:PE domain-containing protein [Mycobacterium attenuatum]ORB87772.1 lipase [Mycobacterium kansasii]VBA36620.1 Triacylglycerol lipase [Mycobacterium attenuatum]VBA49179.1 Triacylglycerol lipase [Mycobacterium attenuatum]VBA54710.1 Triacylglycerol lipase [Mycobacterium attenuatum]